MLLTLCDRPTQFLTFLHTPFSLIRHPPHPHSRAHLLASIVITITSCLECKSCYRRKTRFSSQFSKSTEPSIVYHTTRLEKLDRRYGVCLELHRKRTLNTSWDSAKQGDFTIVWSLTHAKGSVRSVFYPRVITPLFVEGGSRISTNIRTREKTETGQREEAEAKLSRA